MNTDPAQSNNGKSQNAPVAPTASVSHGVKESEPIKTVEPIKTLSSETEISPDVKKAGVQILRETIELPPDLQKLGVTPAGSATPVTAAVIMPQVTLPISDDQVIIGLHVQVGNALKWLAYWCIKKLKKAHITLKKIHGKIVRVGIK